MRTPPRRNGSRTGLLAAGPTTLPAVRNAPPAPRNTPPAVRNTPPAVRNTLPAVHNTLPAVRNTLPAVRNTPPAPRTILLLAALLGALLAGPLTGAARGEPAWTTYHRDPGRSGDDTEAGEPIAPVLAWHSVELGAPIWGQPLVLGPRVYVATVGDELYALEASTGRVVWAKSVGTPVPSEALPCGDIEPTVGIVGTPVIDPATATIYAVADTWDAKTEEAHHLLEGLNLATGEETFSIRVDPPGADPKALLQRTALNLDQGRVIFGFGGNDGDCGAYRGTVVSAPQSAGGEPLFWRIPIAPPSSTGGAVWGASGPAVDGAGAVYASTGNPNPPAGKRATQFDYSDGMVELGLSDFHADPATEQTAPLGWFKPPNWEAASNSDADLGSAGPELLPGGLLFQAGKAGVGYLLDEAAMGSGAQAVYSHEVCGGAGSFGGDAYAAGVIYLACTNGVQALAYDQAARTFTPRWQGPSNAIGPPIVAAGLVWVVATGWGGGETLYGLDPASGKPRYTETLPSPVADHFASPSAAGGRLFVASGSSVSAYQIAQPIPECPASPEVGASAPGCPPGGGPGPGGGGGPGSGGGGTSGSGGGGQTTGAPGGAGASTARHRSRRPVAHLDHRQLRVTPAGRVHVTLRCVPAGSTCRGTIHLHAAIRVRSGHGRQRRSRVVIVPLAHSNFGPAGGEITLTLHLDRAARAVLARHRGHVALSAAVVSL